MLPTFALFYYVAQASLEHPLKAFLRKYAYGCFACIYACIPYVCLVLEEARRRHWISLEPVTDGCALPWEWWELNLGPLDR